MLLFMSKHLLHLHSDATDTVQNTINHSPEINRQRCHVPIYLLKFSTYFSQHRNVSVTPTSISTIHLGALGLNSADTDRVRYTIDHCEIDQQHCNVQTVFR
jgi:hypothetical protein